MSAWKKLYVPKNLVERYTDKDVNYYNVNCNVGLDRLIRKCLNKKTKLLDEVKTEITKVGAKEWLRTI